MPRPNPIRDFAALADQGSTLLHNEHRDSGVDALAANPLRFARFLAELAVRSGHMTKAAQRRLNVFVEKFELEDGPAADALHNAGRAMFAARKQCKLKRDRV
jgi:hypothetical protein